MRDAAIRFTFLLLLLPACAAQAQVIEKPVADRAALEKKFRRLSDSTTTLVCDFIQKKEISVITETVVSRGSMYFKKDNKIRWEYLEPIPYRVVILNGRMTIRDENGVSSFDAAGSAIFNDINKLILDCLQGNIFDTALFDVSLFESRNGLRAAIRPMRASLARLFTKIDLHIDAGVTAVKGITIHERGGDTTTLEFIHTKINAPVGDEIFTAD